MTRAAPALALALPLSLVGACAPSPDECGDVSSWYTEPGQLVVSGSYAFAAVYWYPLDSGCFDSELRVHAIELGAAPAARASKRVGGSILGEGVAAGGRVLFASGADDELFALDDTPPFDIDRIGLPGVPLAAAAAGGNAFFPLYFQDAVWRAPASGDGDAIPVAQPLGAAAASGVVYVSTAAGSVAEIDGVSGDVLREIPSCAATGPVTVSSGGRLVLACAGGGAGVLDLASSNFDTDGASVAVAAVSGAPTSAAAIWSYESATGDRLTQVFRPGTGGVGETLAGWLSDDAVFAGEVAYASLDGTPWRIALSGSGSTLVTGFGTEAGARLAAYDDVVLVLSGGAGDARLHRLDAATGAALGSPLVLPSP